ncbi:hypothetical protein BCD48_25620 [Pseudofrankia sp. BMG5.36]|nr:hypothetical protein BCD48_25620 [Pseudofrankia sp. BMG5.36]
MPAPRNSGLDYHAARIILLISAFTRESGHSIDGLTKLAKLDFLLRYPAFLEKLATALSFEMPDDVQPTPSERLAVESRMIRYKYGPWDDRYYPVVGLLLGTGLVASRPGQGRISLSITDKGRQISDLIAAEPAWELLATRCTYLAKSFNLSGNRLKNLIYDHLPEAVDRPHRSTI